MPLSSEHRISHCISGPLRRSPPLLTFWSVSWQSMVHLGSEALPLCLLPHQYLSHSFPFFCTDDLRLLFSEILFLQSLQSLSQVHFTARNYSLSGLKVDALEVHNAQYRPFKGVRCITKAGRFQVRCWNDDWGAYREECRKRRGRRKKTGKEEKGIGVNSFVQGKTVARYCGGLILAIEELRKEEKRWKVEQMESWRTEAGLWCDQVSHLNLNTWTSWTEYWALLHSIDAPVPFPPLFLLLSFSVCCSAITPFEPHSVYLSSYAGQSVTIWPSVFLLYWHGRRIHWTKLLFVVSVLFGTCSATIVYLPKASCNLELSAMLDDQCWVHGRR